MNLYKLDGSFIREAHNCPTNFTGFVKDLNGTKIWFLEGTWHREDGPAYEDAGGYKQWYVDDKLHRLGGPAIEYPDGTIFYYIDNIERTKEEHDLLFIVMKLKGLM